MSRGSVAVFLAASSWLSLHEVTARAQGAGLAAAEALFDDGKRLMERGAYTDACPKLAASLRLDVGIGAMLYLAECYLDLGRTASAWGQFREAAAVAASRHDAREPLARERAAQLEPRLSRWIVALAGSEDADIAVRRDGELVDRATWTTPVPVDPGVHVVEVSAPGKKPFAATVTVERGPSTVTVTVPRLEDLAPPPSDALPGALGPFPADETPPGQALPARTRPLGTRRVFALGAGSLGLVALGLGTYWGLRAKSSLDDSNAGGHCRGTACDSFGVQARQDAHDQASLSTLAFTVGGSALVAAAAVWLTASTAQRASTSARADIALVPSVGPGTGALVLAGAF
jgi:hypothetical protein